MSRDLQEIMDSEEITNISTPQISNIPQAIRPAYEEGVSFYDDQTKTISVYSDIPDVLLNIGQEQYIRIINKTGSTILNGKAVRHDGVDITTQLPKITLALADTYEHARVLGIATHEIADGEQGFITTHGTVNGLNTIALPAGVPVYLSDTIPGDYQATNPDIVTQLGGILLADPTDGALHVLLDNTIAIPTLFGILQDVPDTYDLTTTYQNLTNYQVEDAVTLVLDKAAGTIQVPNAGRYRGTFNIGLTVPTSPTTRGVTVQAYNVTQATEGFSYDFPIPKDTTILSRSMAVPFTNVADDVIVMRIKSDVAIAGVVINDISYDIQSISVTN